MPSRHREGWSARWNDHEGKRRRMTFRFKRDAEAYERKMKGDQEEIRRGLRGLPPPAKPFEAICTYWIDHRAVQKRGGHHDESIIRAHLRPAFGALMLHQISPIHFDKFIVERQHLTKKTIANHLTLLGAMLNVAKEIGWLSVVPRIRKPKVRIFNADFSLRSRRVHQPHPCPFCGGLGHRSFRWFVRMAPTRTHRRARRARVRR